MHQKTSSSASRPLPHIEFYRGMTITCELSHVNASQQMIDRLWAMRIAAAPNAAARREILEDELRLIEQIRSRRTTRASKNPLGHPRKVRENAELV
jgi:hypothetical protein